MTGFRQTLRLRTRTAHERVDALYRTIAVEERAGYARLLRTHAHALAAIEARMAAVPECSFPLTLSALARADLETLSEAPPRPGRFPRLDRAHPVGIAYVVTGAHFGLSVLRARWSRSDDAAVRAAGRYLHSDAMRAYWPTVLQLIATASRFMACHHNTPKILSYEIRTAAELFGQLFAFVLDEKQSELERSEAERARAVHDSIMAHLAEGSSIVESFDVILSAVASIIPFDGAVGWVDGTFRAQGQAPNREEFLRLARFLNTTGASGVYATDSIAKVYPEGHSFVGRAAGMLALPFSRAPRDYLVLFRREIAESVTWAGNPAKPVEVGPNGTHLTPRKSFEKWREVVRQHSAPWTGAELRAAEALRVTLLEVILQLADASLREREQARMRQDLLIDELNHRIRNILSLIRSLITLSRSESASVAEFTEVIGGRIHALARAHDQISQQNWAAASVRDLIEAEAAAYLGAGADRVAITGPDASMQPHAFTALALVLHEMVTNSAKHGALSGGRGAIHVGLVNRGDGALVMDWREEGGPPVRPPIRRGFGTTVIERSIPYELGGEAELDFQATGLRARFVVPAHHVAGFSAPRPRSSPPETDSAPLRVLSGPALIVEDKIVIALDTEEILKELGAETVLVAASSSEALRTIESHPLGFALLDIDLDTETSEAVGSALEERGIPFVFASGYSADKAVAEQHQHVPLLRKPYTRGALAAAIRSLT